MAAVTPATTNRCLGQYEDGTVNRKLYCYRGLDSEGDPRYSCAGWRKFRANCRNSNLNCNSLSEAYVAAGVVCRQRLF